MAQQTINIGASPNDGTGTPLRTAFQYTNSNFSELYTAVGPSGNNIVVPGSATITGDLTVDTSTLKVDSANDRVGIGIATPAWPLDIRSATAVAQILSTTGTNAAYLQVSNTGGIFYLGRENSAGTSFASPAYSAVLYAGGAYPLVTTVNGSERYRIASDGVATWSNVGGVAGTAMTLNSTGLGVGGSPTAKLSVVGGNIRLDNNQGLEWGGANNYIYGSEATDFIALVTNGVEALRINNSQNIGIGVTPSAWASYKALQVGSIGSLSSTTGATIVGNNWFYDGASKYITTAASTIYEQGAGTHAWYSAASGTAGTAVSFGSAKMTLDASGNLLVAKTSVGDTNIGFQALASGVVTATRSASTDGAGTSYVLYSTGASAYRFYIGMGGTVFATNTTISAISDARLKENVQDIDVGLGAILALKPRKFDWKEGKGKNIKGDRGFIAQEFESVFPQLVDEWKDEAPEGEAPYKSVRQDLIPVLVKAIQELAAKVQALEAKLA